LCVKAGFPALAAGGQLSALRRFLWKNHPGAKYILSVRQEYLRLLKKTPRFARALVVSVDLKERRNCAESFVQGHTRTRIAKTADEKTLARVAAFSF
jgi:hypothetical protein